MELSRIGIFGLTIIGLGGVLLAGYVVHRLSQRQHTTIIPQPPEREFDWSEDSQRLSYGGDSDTDRKRRAEQWQGKQPRKREA